MTSNKLLIICGPTATGKTALAIHLAKQFNGELISADSRQVYRGMDLVTGKERADVPIWLYDVVKPDEEFSVSHWVKLAKNAISDIQTRNKLPIVVGGTGLYIRALLDPLETIDIGQNKRLRQKLAKLTVQGLQTMISRNNINDSDWHNPRRLIRKIEIANFKRSHLARQGETLKKEEVLIIGLSAPIRILDERIDKRMKVRLKAGLEREIDELTKNYDRNLPAMSAIGVNEHAYARRQMTWFKKQKGIHWFDITKPAFVADVTQKVASWYTTKASS